MVTNLRRILFQIDSLAAQAAVFTGLLTFGGTGWAIVNKTEELLPVVPIVGIAVVVLCLILSMGAFQLSLI